MSALPELTALLEELRSISERELKAELLIEYSERFVEVPESVACRPFPEANRVPACESEAFVFKKDLPDEHINFYFAVESPQGISAMALAAILTETVSGKSREAIGTLDDDIVYDIFGRGISMGKGLGLRSMVQMVRQLAKA